MFGLSTTTDGIPTLEDEHVIAGIEIMREKQALVETLEADEARLLRVLNPLPNSRAATDEEIAEAIARLDIKKGTQNGWFLPELGPARAALKDAITNLEACRAEAVTKLDEVRRVQRKPLIAEWVSALDMLLAAREAVLAFDAQWGADRDSSWPTLERTTLEPLMTADSVDRMKQMLKAQAWI
jgi:hypothetical protein